MPIYDQTFSRDLCDHPVHDLGHSKFQQNLQQSTQLRSGLSEGGVEEVGQNIVGNHTCDSRFQRRGAQGEACAQR